MRKQALRKAASAARLPSATGPRAWRLAVVKDLLADLRTATAGGLRFTLEKILKIVEPETAAARAELSELQRRGLAKALADLRAEQERTAPRVDVCVVRAETIVWTLASWRADRTDLTYSTGTSTRRTPMNAIKMLKQQHREVEKLFQHFAGAKSAEPRRKFFIEIADALAIHATIEERHFYPSVKQKQTEEILLESVEEHLEMKRAIADLLKLDAGEDQFQAKMDVLREDVEHHVEEEETELFPKVEKLFEPDALEAIGADMAETEEELKRRGNPRNAIPGETGAAAPL